MAEARIDEATKPPLTHLLRIELHANGKRVASQEVAIPVGLSLKLGTMCAAQLLNNAVISAVPDALKDLGFK